MSDTQTLAQRKEVVRRLYEEHLNTGLLDSLDKWVAADYTGPGDQEGPTGFAATIRGVRQGFPDIQWLVEDLIAEDDKVTVRWSWCGTHAGPIMGFAPTGQAVTNQGIGIYQFRGDKIVRAWLLTDRLGFLQQIGAVSQNLLAAPQPQR